MSTKYPDLSETLFPDALDIITRMSDITHSDLDLIRQYNTYVSEGNFEAAQKLLADNPGLQNKIFNAEKFNKLADSIMAVQRFFQEDVQSYITDVGTDLENQMAKFGNVGDYSPDQAYKRFEVARYEGSSYMCVQDCQGQPVTDPEYWVRIAEKGDTGASGAGLAFCGEYSAERQYQKDDCVTDGKQLWAALQPSIGQPLVEGEYWTVAVAMQIASSILVNLTLPSDNWLPSGGSKYQNVVSSISELLQDSNAIVGLSSDATEEQRKAAQKAVISIASYSDGEITFNADGTKPQVDIPATLIILN